MKKKKKKKHEEASFREETIQTDVVFQVWKIIATGLYWPKSHSSYDCEIDQKKLKLTIRGKGSTTTRCIKLLCSYSATN